MNKHLIELLSEDQFTTVEAYFRSEADTQQPTAPPKRRYSSEPPNYADMIFANETKFPFIEQALPSRVYVYKCSKEMASLLHRGDNVVVPMQHGGYSVGKVWNVHKTPLIDFEANHKYTWIVSKVDDSAYLQQLAKEAEFTKLLQQVEATQKREALRTAIFQNVAPGSEAYNVFAAALGVLGVQTPTLPAPAAAAPVAAPATTGKK